MTELEALKTALADSAARSDLECFTDRNLDGWHSLDTVSSHHMADLETAVRYLTLRGLLKHHPMNARLVRVANES